MASNTANIQILRSYVNTQPATLLDGQLAYSFAAQTLYIGNTSNTPIAITDTATKSNATSP